MRRALRIGVFAALTVFMMAGPFCDQVLGIRTPLFRRWTMFSSVGIGLADLSFSVRRADGTLSPINYYQVLGYADPLNAPRSIRRVVGVAGVHRVAARICSILGPGTDLRANVRIAERSGWWPAISENSGNLCKNEAQ
jgi:hypothetical protein